MEVLKVLVLLHNMMTGSCALYAHLKECHLGLRREVHVNYL